MTALGLRNLLLDLEALLKLLDMHVAVAIGPFATYLWRWQTAGEENLHTEILSFLFAHHLLGFTATSHYFSPAAPSDTTGNRQSMLCCLPRHLLLQDQAVDFARIGLCHCLSDFLRASRLDVWGLALQQEQMTVGLLASLSFADLRAALPSVLVGILLKMQVAAKNWIEKSVSTLVLL